MYIKDVTNEAMLIREISYSVLVKSILLFTAALLITINGKNGENNSVTSLFLTGPLLMALSFSYAIFFFKNISILVDREKSIMTKVIRTATKTTVTNFRLGELHSVEILPAPKFLGDISGKAKCDILLSFAEDDYIKLNYIRIKESTSKKIGSRVAEFLNVPFIKINKPGIIKTIISLKDVIK